MIIRIVMGDNGAKLASCWMLSVDGCWLLEAEWRVESEEEELGVR